MVVVRNISPASVKDSVQTQTGNQSADRKPVMKKRTEGKSVPLIPSLLPLVLYSIHSGFRVSVSLCLILVSLSHTHTVTLLHSVMAPCHRKQT